MAQQRKISKNNTTIKQNEEGYTVITLHSTEIVKFNREEVILNHGGFVTTTTATRMNQVSNALGLDYYVRLKAGEMLVTFGGVESPMNGKTVTLQREN